jgi:iron complex transport system ATP-binding protein
VRIITKNIEFTYNKVPAIKDVSINVKKGEIVALVGPNGSGKSTLIKCLNRILKIQHGTIIIDNKDINSYNQTELANKIAYVPQSESYKGEIKVFDMILLGRKPYFKLGPSENDLGIVTEIIKYLHLENIAMTGYNKLSGGQQQTVLIARALAQKPEILLLDEPTSNLDIRCQIKVLELLENLAKTGISIVVAVHDINIAIRFAEKIVMMKQGKVFATSQSLNITEDMLSDLFSTEIRLIKEHNYVFAYPVGTSQKDQTK